MKNCTYCNIEKTLDEFSWKNKSKNLKSSKCKECQRKYSKKHYNNNKEYYNKKTKKQKKEYIKINRQYVWDFLSNNPCVDCGENDPVVLEFDHIKNKRDNISRMIFQCTPNILKKEIKKCEVRCANCHARKTARDYGFYKYIIK